MSTSVLQNVNLPTLSLKTGVKTISYNEKFLEIVRGIYSGEFCIEITNGEPIDRIFEHEIEF